MQTSDPAAPFPLRRYHVARGGQNAGVFSAAELRAKRASAEFTGGELIWRPGMADWGLIDDVLALDGSLPPPPLPRQKRASRWIWISVAVVGLVVVAAGLWGMFRLRSFFERVIATSAGPSQTEGPRGVASRFFAPTPDGMDLAGPIKWPSTSRTAMDERESEKDFRVRHYLNAYLKHARRDNPADADAVSFIETWNTTWLAGAKPEDSARFWELHGKLAAKLESQDPFVRMLLVSHDTRMENRIPAMETALRDMEAAGYPAMTRLWVTIRLTTERGRRTLSLEELNTSALALLRQALRDGELTPGDGVLVADRFVESWSSFFQAHRDQICEIFANAGPAQKWTSLVLEGERQIALAWRARGGGYANTVTESGWEGFRVGLEKASAAFDEAWRMHPDRVQAAARMVYVALSQSEPRAMREWFDRAIAVRADHLGAWNQLRFGLYPRWHGSHEAMLKLGIEAVNTGRFDTYVPDQLYHAISDIERDMKLPNGKHIYGRKDIWPHLRRMYEGYIAEKSPGGVAWREGWRSAYACVAFIAEDYATARRQLEAVDWKPAPGEHPEWDIDLSLMPLEVAARTGSQAELATRAEAAWDRGDTSEAKALFQKVAAAADDERTREFARRRVAGAEGAGF